MENSETPKENELLNIIRQKTRDDIHKSQLSNRLSTFDRQRCGLSEIQATIQEYELLTEKDVQGLASRIKRRKSATSTDLKRLSAAFLHNSNNIETFTKITGALNVVVKEFSGTESEHQVLAAECLCNLGLGDDVCSRKVAQAAGTYLVLYLDNLYLGNKMLVETCLWVLQNLLLSGEKTRTVLIAQGVPDKLVALVKGVKDDEIRRTAEETLAILVVEAWKDLPEGFPMKFLGLLKAQISRSHSTAFLYAVYTVLMELNFMVDLDILEKSVELSIESLLTALKSGNEVSGQSLISIRIITNALLSTHECNILLKCLSNALEHQNTTLSSLMDQLFSMEIEQISRETLWMTSTLSISGVSDLNLRIPVKYL